MKKKDLSLEEAIRIARTETKAIPLPENFELPPDFDPAIDDRIREAEIGGLKISEGDEYGAESGNDDSETGKVERDNLRPRND